MPHTQSPKLPSKPQSLLTRWTWLTLTLAAVCATGCGNPDRNQLVGKWTLDNSKRVEKRISAPEESSPASRMSLEFRSGGKLITITKMGDIDREKRGTWKFLTYREEEKVAEIECVLGMQTTKHDVQILPDNRIKLAPPNMAGVDLKLTFQRE